MMLILGVVFSNWKKTFTFLKKRYLWINVKIINLYVFKVCGTSSFFLMQFGCKSIIDYVHDRLFSFGMQID